MRKVKTITVRLEEEEHEKLLSFAKKQKLSVNNIIRKAIELNFNFKTQDVIKGSQFLTATPVGQGERQAEKKALLHVGFESLFILRELGLAHSEELVKSARERARQKVDEVMG